LATEVLGIKNKEANWVQTKEEKYPYQRCLNRTSRQMMWECDTRQFREKCCCLEEKKASYKTAKSLFQNTQCECYGCICELCCSIHKGSCLWEVSLCEALLHCLQIIFSIAWRIVI
jgi:hypothetical protein